MFFCAFPAFFAAFPEVLGAMISDSLTKSSFRLDSVCKIRHGFIQATVLTQTCFQSNSSPWLQYKLFALLLFRNRQPCEFVVIVVKANFVTKKSCQKEERVEKWKERQSLVQIGSVFNSQLEESTVFWERATMRSELVQGHPFTLQQWWSIWQPRSLSLRAMLHETTKKLASFLVTFSLPLETTKNWTSSCRALPSLKEAFWPTFKQSFYQKRLKKRQRLKWTSALLQDTQQPF